MELDFLKTFRKCQFCHIRDNNLQYIPRIGMYGDANFNWAYHSKCLNMVACNPEDYTSSQVDIAIDIIDQIKSRKRREEKRIKDANERCDYLKEQCI